MPGSRCRSGASIRANTVAKGSARRLLSKHVIVDYEFAGSVASCLRAKT